MAKNKTVSQEQKEQRLLAQLIHNEQLFLKGITFLKKEYFVDPVHIDIVDFINEYYKKYQSIPLPEIVVLEIANDHDIDEDYLDIDEPWIDSYLEDHLNNFIQTMSMRIAIEKSIDHLGKENYTAIEGEIKEAVNVDLSIEAGTTITSDKDSFNVLFDAVTAKENTLPTGWPNADNLLEGGTNIPSLNYIFAKSGGGKSVGLLNLAKNYTTQGRDALYVSLELNEEKIIKRFLSHSSKISMYELEQSKMEIYTHLQSCERAGHGKFTVQYFQPNTLNAKKLELVVKNYIQIHGNTPIIIVDYAELMIPNNNNWQGMFEKDKFVAEELRGLAAQFNTVVWSAGQFNRCLLTTEKVQTQRGSIEIQNVTTEDRILTHSNRMAKVKHVYDIQEQECYEIVLKSGKRVVCSGKHMWPKANTKIDSNNLDDAILDNIETSLKVGDKLWVEDI